MKIQAKRIKIFKIKNRKGYAALCLGYLTEGTTTYQVYDRMRKALRRNDISLKAEPSNLKTLVTAIR